MSNFRRQSEHDNFLHYTKSKQYVNVEQKLGFLNFLRLQKKNIYKSVLLNEKNTHTHTCIHIDIVYVNLEPEAAMHII